jgi:rRNA methylases
MITSKSNAKIKNVQALQKYAKTRKEQAAYVVEGAKMFAELPHASIKELYVTAAFVDKYAKSLQGLPYEVVDERVFAQMSATKTPQGILCVVTKLQYQLSDLLGKVEPLLLILEDLQDPGNVGTIFRTAEGAGVDGIIMSENCVDIYNPKTIRGTMGSIYRVPFIYTTKMQAIIEQLKAKKITIYAAHLSGEKIYDQEDYSKGSAFLLGNEGNGLSEALTERANKLIKIPMAGEIESLNVAIAATILTYESSRQRRQ